jgi:hypothetical protein
MKEVATLRQMSKQGNNKPEYDRYTNELEHMQLVLNYLNDKLLPVMKMKGK